MELRNMIPWRRGKDAEVPVHYDDADEIGDAFATLQQRFNRIFDDFFRGFDLEPFSGRAGELLGRGAAPRMDVSETGEAIRVEAELPGVDAADVELSLGANALVLRGEKRGEEERESAGRHRTERWYGSFERRIPLPCEIDAERVEARFEKGVLSVVLPKAPAARARTRRIEVQSGG